LSDCGVQQAAWVSTLNGEMPDSFYHNAHLCWLASSGSRCPGKKC
jgi:hypothetical protein